MVHGPKPRDFSKKVTRKTKQLALRKAFTERVNAGEVTVLEDIKLDSPKTKGFVGILNSLKVEGTTLLVAENGNQNLILASRNVEGLELTNPHSVNTYQLLRAKNVLFTRSAIEVLDARLKGEAVEGNSESAETEKPAKAPKAVKAPKATKAAAPKEPKAKK